MTESNDPFENMELDLRLAHFESEVSRDLKPCEPLTDEDLTAVRRMVRKEINESGVREIMRKVTALQPWKQAYMRISREEFDPTTLDQPGDDNSKEERAASLLGELDSLLLDPERSRHISVLSQGIRDFEQKAITGVSLLITFLQLTRKEEAVQLKLTELREALEQLRAEE